MFYYVYSCSKALSRRYKSFFIAAAICLIHWTHQVKINQKGYIYVYNQQYLIESQTELQCRRGLAFAGNGCMMSFRDEQSDFAFQRQFLLLSYIFIYCLVFIRVG